MYNIGQLIVQEIMQNKPDLHLDILSLLHNFVAILHIFSVRQTTCQHPTGLLSTNVSPLAVQQANCLVLYKNGTIDHHTHF